jgi:hypothetical protein
METKVNLNPEIAAEAAELSDALISINAEYQEVRDRAEAAHNAMWEKINEDPTVNIETEQYHYNYEDHSLTHLDEEELPDLTVASFLMESDTIN